MKRILFVLFMSFAVLSTYAQQIHKVTDRLYMIDGLGGNISVLVSSDGVLLVDAGSGCYDADKVKSLIATVTPLPIKYILLTHYHYDHAFGLCGYGKGITIIGQQNIYRNLDVIGRQNLKNQREVELPATLVRLKNKKDSLRLAKSAELSNAEKEYEEVFAQLADAKRIEVVLPSITFEKSLTLFFGSDTVKIESFGSTHTDCSSVVFFKNQKAIAMGDILFNHNMPYIDYKANSNTQNWIDVLTKLSATDNQYFISGHGAVGSKNDVLLEIQYLIDLRADIKACIDKKATLAQTLKEVKMTKYADWGFQFMLPSEIEAVYKELSK